MARRRGPNWPFDTDRRLAIGWACEDVPRGLAEISRVTGINRGPLSGLLVRMVSDGALETQGDPGKRDTLYQVAPAHRDRLHARLDDEPVGKVQPGQRLVLADASDLSALAGVLERGDLTKTVVWSARIAGTAGGFVFVFSGRSDPIAADRFQAAVEHAGLNCRRGLVEAVLARGGVDDYAASLRDVRHAAP